MCKWVFIPKIPLHFFSEDNLNRPKSSHQAHSSVYRPVQLQPGSINDIDTSNYSTGEFELGYTWFWRYWNCVFLYLSIECKIIQNPDVFNV